MSHHDLAQDLASQLARAWRGEGLLDAQAWPVDAPNAQCADQALTALAEQLNWLPAASPQFWKSGGPSRQTALSHAPLAPFGVRMAPADFSDLRLQRPGVEAEIALRLGQNVDAELLARLKPQDAAELVDGVCVAAELVSSRWQQGQAAPAWLRHADALSHGALALGEWHSRQSCAAIDWSQQTCSIQRNGETTRSARGSHSLGDPFWGLLGWLRHATHEGRSLPAGSVVTTGAWLVLGNLVAGDQICVGFDGLGELKLCV